MNFNKYLIFTITYLLIGFYYSDGYTQETSYDSEEMHKIVRQKCNGAYKRLFSQLKREDINEYKRIVNIETNRCECGAYTAYRVFGVKFMDDWLNRGYSYRASLERSGLAELYKYGTTIKIRKYEELVLKCENKYPY